MALRARLLTSVAATIGAAVTLGVSLIPSLRFAYRSPELHIAFDTAEGLIALTAAYLVFGRLGQRELLRDALLAFALLLIGSANLLLLMSPPLGAEEETQAFPIWLSLIIRVIGSGAIASAAFAGTRRIPPLWARGRRIPLVTGAVFILGVTLAYLAATTISLGLAPRVSPLEGDPLIQGSATLLAAQLVLVALYVTAAFGFTKAAETDSRDPFLRWLGPGTTLNAFARVNFFLYPSLYTEFIYVGDFLRLAFYLLLLVGATQEIRLYWQRLEADIAEHERLNTELEALSLTDPLTGLNNRRGFEALAEHAMTVAARSKTPLALMYIDLNDMKSINDVHGHNVGDDALREVASILSETLRDSDIIARLGGDEFCALLIDARDVDSGPARLHALVESLNQQDRRAYRLSLSIGIANWDPAHPQPLHALMELADAEMYANKRARPRRASILVIEDDPSVKHLIRVEMSDGYEVVEASTASEALSMLPARPPQLVILDYYLPDATGLDIVQRLRRALGTKVRIVVLTGAADVDEATVLRAGADDYLEKPFEPDVLAARIERLLATSRTG